MSAVSVPFRRFRARPRQATAVVGAVVALIIAGFCAASGAMLYDLRQETWDRAVISETNLLNALSRDIAQRIEIDDLSLQAVVDGLKEPDLAGLSPHLQDLLLYGRAASAKDLGTVQVLDRTGRLIRSLDEKAVGSDLADRDYFQAHKTDPDLGLFISAPFRRAGSVDVLALSRRLQSPDGSFTGVAAVIMHLSHFRDLFEHADLGPHGIINLLRVDGISLMRVPYAAGQVGRSFASSANFKRYLAVGAPPFIGTSISDGVERIYDFAPVGKLPLVLSVAFSADDVFSAWSGKTVIIAVALLFLCVTAWVLWVILVRQMKRTAQARRMLSLSEAQYRLLADHAKDVIMRLDRSLRWTYVSPAALTILGYSPEALVGQASERIIHPDDWQDVVTLTGPTPRHGENIEVTCRVLHADGHPIWMEGRYSFVEEDGGFIVVLRDVTTRKAAEEKLATLNAELEHIARSDALTGLANRRRFDEAMDVEWRRARREDGTLSLLMIDVDRFKAYNDLYGHQEGDACLRAVAGAVSDVVRRPGDVTARYGGEELAVVLPGTGENGAMAMADRIRLAVEGIRRPHSGNTACGGIVTVSIGCATMRPGRDPGAEPPALIGQADARLYEAKRMGRNRVMDHLPTAPVVPTPLDEERRLAVLAAYEAAGAAAPSETLDRIAHMAAHLLDAPIAFVSLVGRDDVTLAGRHGLDILSAPRDSTFCSHTIHGDAPLVIPDTLADPRFSSNPFARDGIGFYAGAPLISPLEGRKLGALCIAGTGPRAPLDENGRNLLASLARMVTDDLDRRRILHEATAEVSSEAA